jgi:hypothetical protein
LIALRKIREVSTNGDFINAVLTIIAASVTAVATAYIAKFTKTLYAVTRDQLMHNRRVERAYIKMSPKAPGIKISPDGRIDLKTEVKNFGTTPGRVTDLVICSNLGPRNNRLPTPPEYDRDNSIEIADAFLVTEDFFTVGCYFTIPKDEVDGVRNGGRAFAVFGHVDYIDQFGDRHRAGFGRRYDRTSPPEMNLVYMVERGYNYDRPRIRGEGDDWD